MLSRLAAARRQLLLPPRGAPAVAYRSSSSSSAAAAAVHGVAPAPASASVLPDTLDRGSDAYQRNAAAVGGLLSDLRARVSQVLVLPSYFLDRAIFLELALCLCPD
jgi:3-methylcrotonyl-CoA carboxylase beta subunit